MTWIAIADHKSQTQLIRSVPDVLARGTLMMETRLSPLAEPRPILELKCEAKRAAEMVFRNLPTGGVHFLFRFGTEILHAALPIDAEDHAGVVRLSYSWDLVDSEGQLVVEVPGTQKVYRKSLSVPLPIPQSLVSRLLELGKTDFAQDLVFAAISDRVEPIGPAPALDPKTPVLTPHGYRAVGTLQRGDVVTTLDGKQVPVLQTIQRDVPARGSFQPVRLRHPFFGLADDIFVTPEARLVVGGSKVDYLFGADKVLVPVKHLVSGGAARLETGLDLVSYVQLLLPDHEAIVAAGTGLESLNIGRLRRNSDLLKASALGNFERNSLPEHSKTAFPVLRHFEAVTLSEHKAA